MDIFCEECERRKADQPVLGLCCGDELILQDFDTSSNNPHVWFLYEGYTIDSSEVWQLH